MDTIEILTVILLISASALSLALIYFVYKFVKSVRSIGTAIKALSDKLTPILKSTFVFLEKLTRITDEVESQLQISKSVVSDIRDHTDKILNVETKIRNGISDAAVPLLNNFRAIRKGISSFWKTLKSK
ncbi:MAG: hypothetical protein OQK65_11900 [Chlorobium sp.]|nr:hypothetical protein [Chlorobium sp.]